MKNIYILTSVILLLTCGSLRAQLENRRFISGSAGLNFGNTKPEIAKGTNDYGYNFDLSFGKFKTNSKVVGWRISSSLAGGDNHYTLFNGTSVIELERSGVKGVGFGVGRFWHYYKQFNNKVGIFGGPNIDLGFNHTRNYSVSTNSTNNAYLFENKEDKIQLSLGLTAGVYYSLSEKWWINASLGFSDPVSVNYSFVSASNSNIGTENDVYKTRQLGYTLSPQLHFPNVALGLRYFYRR